MPTAFSPNGDQINDLFGPVYACTYESYHFQIFNRWGQLIFDSADPAQRWDGRFKGAAVMEGVYVWRLSYRSVFEQNSVELKGSVTVVR